jgi:hypothetical protein
VVLPGLFFAQPDPPALKHREQSFTIRLNGSAAEVTPLFGPVGEAEWAPGWMPDFIYPTGGKQVEGAVFTTRGHNGEHRIWILTAFDEGRGRIEYVVITSDVTVNEIKIAVVPNETAQAQATITYRYTALSLAGNQEVEKLGPAWAEQQRTHWETAINQALHKGKLE